MVDFLPIGSFVLNLLLLPLLAILWDMRIKLAKLETTLCSQGIRISNIEDRVNRHMEHGHSVV